MSSWVATVKSSSRNGHTSQRHAYFYFDMHTYVCVYIYICNMHITIYTYIYAYVYIYIYTHDVSIFIYIRTYLHIYIYNIYICTHTHIYIYICVRIFGTKEIGLVVSTVFTSLNQGYYCFQEQEEWVESEKLRRFLRSAQAVLGAPFGHLVAQCIQLCGLPRRTYSIFFWRQS